MNEECGNPEVVVDGRDLTRNINQKKKPGVLQACRCPLCEKCNRQSISSTSLWNFANQLGKYDYFYGSVINNLKERQPFSDQMNRNCFDLKVH